MRQYQDHNRRRNTVESLIRDLGYCCMWGFFRFVSKRTGMIAARLGVTERAVRYAKAKFASAEIRCENRESCLKCKLKGRI